MDIKVLPLPLFVEKFHEPCRPGCRYEVDAGKLYRVRNGEAEDIGELGEDLAAAALPPIDFGGGVYVGEPETIAELRLLSRKLCAMIDEAKRLMRS